MTTVKDETHITLHIVPILNGNALSMFVVYNEVGFKDSAYNTSTKVKVDKNHDKLYIMYNLFNDRYNRLSIKVRSVSYYPIVNLMCENRNEPSSKYSTVNIKHALETPKKRINMMSQLSKESLFDIPH